MHQWPMYDRAAIKSSLAANRLITEWCCGRARQVCLHPRTKRLPALNTELSVDRSPILFHGGRADAAHLGDVGARVTLYIQYDKIALAWRQAACRQRCAYGC